MHSIAPRKPGGFFVTKTRSVVAQARHYLSGLMQAARNIAAKS